MSSTALKASCTLGLVVAAAALGYFGRPVIERIMNGGTPRVTVPAEYYPDHMYSVGFFEKHGTPQIRSLDLCIEPVKGQSKYWLRLYLDTTHIAHFGTDRIDGEFGRLNEATLVYLAKNGIAPVRVFISEALNDELEINSVLHQVLDPFLPARKHRTVVASRDDMEHILRQETRAGTAVEWLYQPGQMMRIRSLPDQRLESVE